MSEVAPQVPYLTVLLATVFAAAYCYVFIGRGKDIARMERGLWNQRHYEVRPHPEVSFSSDGKHASKFTLYPDPSIQSIQRQSGGTNAHAHRSILRQLRDDSVVPFWPYHVAGTPTQLFAFKLVMTFVLLMPFLLGAAVGFLCLTTTRASPPERKSRRIGRRKIMRTVEAAVMLIEQD